MEEAKGTVCVTGGTGYIASWLVMRLLQQGFSVRATVRSDPSKILFSLIYGKLIIYIHAYVI
jgi:nucleoside-diphosphate-sugar epimerase